jgi:hypothetical protein
MLVSRDICLVPETDMRLGGSKHEQGIRSIAASGSHKRRIFWIESLAICSRFTSSEFGRQYR